MILVIETKAIGLISGMRHKMASMKKTRIMIRTGIKVLGFTLWSVLEKGKAPSLAIAKPILEVTVILLKPAKNMFISSKTTKATAPVLLNAPSSLVNA